MTGSCLQQTPTVSISESQRVILHESYIAIVETHKRVRKYKFLKKLNISSKSDHLTFFSVAKKRPYIYYHTLGSLIFFICSTAINKESLKFHTSSMLFNFFFLSGFLFLLGESGLVGDDVVIRIERFLVQTPLGARPALGTQPLYEAPGDSRFEIVKTQWLTSD